MTLVQAERDRGTLWSGRIGVVLVLVASGMLFAASAHTARGTQLRTDTSDAQSLLEAENKRIDELTAQNAALYQEVQREISQAGAGDGVATALGRQADALGSTAGTRAVKGPALRITLDDAPRSARIPDGVRPDDLVVHQQDVQAVVNALWAGGAEAMMLQDQRVISTSAVRCVGNTLILQGRVYSPPYTITAIGNDARMRSALSSSPEVTIYRQYVDALGLGYTVEKKNSVTMPAYAGTLSLEHAGPVATATPEPSSTTGSTASSTETSRPSPTEEKS